jgi:Winged helix DNA-binding domain
MGLAAAGAATESGTNAGASQPGVGRYRWTVCALLFFATTINYMDRQILSLLKPILDNELHWTNEQFGQVNAAFQAAYAVGLLGFGAFIDRFGTRVSELVDELETAGVLKRSPDPDDARAKLISFTPRGLQGLLHGLDVLRDFEQELSQTIGVRSMLNLRATLLRVLASLETMP